MKRNKVQTTPHTEPADGSDNSLVRPRTILSMSILFLLRRALTLLFARRTTIHDSLRPVYRHTRWPTLPSADIVIASVAIRSCSLIANGNVHVQLCPVHVTADSYNYIAPCMLSTKAIIISRPMCQGPYAVIPDCILCLWDVDASRGVVLFICVVLPSLCITTSNLGCVPRFARKRTYAVVVLIYERLRSWRGVAVLNGSYQRARSSPSERRIGPA